MQSREQAYYENELLWQAEEYLSDSAELKRFAACADGLPTVNSLLDVGTGNGAFLWFLENKQPQRAAIQLTGLERSQMAIQHAVCKAPIQTGNADELPFPDQAFDAVSALEVIEHLPYEVYERSLDELQRVAKQYILLSVPYRENRRSNICPYCGCHFNIYYHMRRFTDDTLRGLFPKFSLVSTNYVTVDEYIFIPPARLLLSKIDLPMFRDTAICPQCGYHKPATLKQKAAPTGSPSGLKAAIKAAIPKWPTRRWAVVLYERKP